MSTSCEPNLVYGQTGINRIYAYPAKAGKYGVVFSYSYLAKTGFSGVTNKNAHFTLFVFSVPLRCKKIILKLVTQHLLRKLNVNFPNWTPVAQL